MVMGAGGKRFLLAALAGVLALGVVACSPMTRYQVLSFFFDGVPPPPGMVVEKPPTEEPRRTSAFAAGLRALREEATPPEAPPRIVSVHEPYQERNCQQCHDMTHAGMKDPARDASLCDRCHIDQRKEEGWDHGPINLGTCVPCHVPHASVYPSLLYTPVPDLCLDCHVDVTRESREEHDVPNFPNCVECHDPHRMY